MPKRNFELFCLHLCRDLSVLGALKETAAGEACSFTWAQAQMLERVKKKNTELFDQLAQALGLPYEVSENTLDTFLYDVILVDMLERRFEGDLCIAGADGRSVRIIPREKMPEWIYAHGFTITGVPRRDAQTGRRTGSETEDVRYRAFIASASMARKGQYAFVNEDVYDELMERVSLGFVRCGAGHGLTLEPLADRTTVFASKLSAYLGLSLSDGSSVREMQAVWRQAKGTNPPELPLDAESVAVVPDYTVEGEAAKRLFADKGPFVWTSEEIPPAMRRPEEDAALAAMRRYDAGARQLCAFFRAFAGGDKALRAYVRGREEEIARAWRDGIERILAAGEIPEYAEGLLPVPEGSPAEGEIDPLLSCVEQYAWPWLLALTQRCLRAPGSAGTDDLGAALTGTLSMLERERLQDGRGCACWNTLFNLLKESGKCVCACVHADGEPEPGWRYFTYASGEGRAQRIACWCGERPRAVYGARLTRVEELEDFSVNHSDGVGFCDPEYFDQLERLLLLREEPLSPRRFDAIIVRLPWLKGVLVRMDFRAYFAAQGEKADGITDLFGVRRDLSKVHVLVTKSMFKGCAYLKALKDVAPGADLWREYWARVEKYGASLLIAGRNSVPSARSRLNYQFLSTIGFTDAELHALAEDAVTEMQGLLTDPGAQRAYFLKNVRGEEPEEVAGTDEGAPAEASEEGEAPSTDTDELFARALLRRPELIESGYARRALQGKARNILIDSMMGRLPVEGDVRVLTPDLKMLLDYICLRRVRGDQSAPIGSAVNAGGSAHGCYYAPGAEAPWNRDGGRTVAILRNPHFAVGEDALLEPLPAEARAQYDEFFGDLTGIVMIPASAFSTINGADADGDRANVCSDGRVVRAVRRTTAENVRLLNGILRRRGEIAGWIGERLASLTGVPAAKRDRDCSREIEYWRQLLGWMQLALPDADAAEWAADYCPALIFGASTGGRGGFRARETAKPGALEAKIWRAFELTTRQRIGIMSIQALELAGVAYAKATEECGTDAETARAAEGHASAQGAADGPEEKSEQNGRGESDANAGETGAAVSADVPADAGDPCELLRRWLWHWRVVTCGLDAANEIDMAKTGLMLAEHPLRSPFEAGRKCSDALRRIEQKSPSALREMRTQREKALADLAQPWRFAGRMNEIRKSLQSVRPAAGAEHHPLDMLPYWVYDDLAARLDGGPDAEQKASARRLKFPDAHGKRLIEIARGREAAAENAHAEEISAAIAAYSAHVRRRKHADSRRQAQFDRFGYCMRNLQRRYSLAEAFRQLRACAGDGTLAGSFLERAGVSGGAPLMRLYNSLESDAVLARLVWAETPEARGERIAQLIRAAGVEGEIELPEAIVRDEQGVYLFKELVKYLKEAEAVQCLPAPDGVNTPEGLRERLTCLAGGAEALYSCLLGQGALDDFLLLQLGGAVFAEKMKAEEK